MSTFLRVAFAISGFALAALIVAAAIEAPIGPSFARITEDLWGWVTLFDLYLGFLILSVIIALTERHPLRAAAWILPLFVLGNVWSVVWFVLRIPLIRARLGGL